MKPIERAIEAKQTQTALADSIGCHQSLISAWVTGRKQVAARWCLPIERATKGVVTRYDLRPDIFGEPEDRGAA